MFSTLMTVIRARSERARDGLEAANATLILEQKIREADAGHDKAKRALATLIMRERSESKHLNALNARIKDLEERTRQALAADMTALAEETAEAIAELENERGARQKALARTELSVQRLRLTIEKCARRLVELRQGLITAHSIDAERDAGTALRGDIAGTAALIEGEAVLERLLGQTDPVEEMEVFEALNAEMRGDALIDRLAAEGFGAATRTRGADVLERLQSNNHSDGEQ